MNEVYESRREYLGQLIEFLKHNHPAIMLDLEETWSDFDNLTMVGIEYVIGYISLNHHLAVSGRDLTVDTDTCNCEVCIEARIQKNRDAEKMYRDTYKELGMELE